MGVHLGFSGQKLLPTTYAKIKGLRKGNRKLNIQVDGGVNETNIEKLNKAGANLFCVGHYLSGDDISNRYKLLKRMVK